MFLELVSNEKNDLGNHLWRYLISIIVVIVFYILGQIPLGIVAFINIQDPQTLMEFAETVDFSLIGISANFGLILIILFFVASFLGLYISIRFIHRKKLKSVITASPAIRWQRVFYAAGLWLILSIILEIISYTVHPENYTFNFNLEAFIPLLFISILLLPVQTSFEEIFIRGYLMQGFGLVGIFRFVPLLITSLLFGSLHIMNPEIDQFGLWIMMSFYVGFGIFLGIITLIDEGLEIPLGIHAANNIYASLLVTYSGGALQTDALFKMTVLDKSFMFSGWLLMAVIFLIVAAREYKWTNWAALLQKIAFNPPQAISTDDQNILADES